MPKLELTDRGIRSAKVPDGARKLDLFDTLVKGLALRVSVSGSRIFYQVYSDDSGKRVWHRLGEYPQPMTLAVAREAARGVRSEVRGGGDPAAEKRAQRASMSVSDLIENYLKRAVSERRSVGEIGRRLRKNVSGRDQKGLPIVGASSGCIGDVKLAELHRRDLTRCIDAIVDRGAGVEANRVFEDIRAMVRWARGRGDIDQNLTEGMRRPTETAERERWLAEDEIATVWAALPEADMSEGSRRILRLCLLTGQRVGEIAGMTRGELDFDAGVWTLPPGRTKNKQGHTVPLSDMAAEIIRDQMADVEALAVRKGVEVPIEIFPAPGFRGSVAAMSLPKATKRLQKEDGTILGVAHWTPHDLRRTAATLMESAGVSPFVIGHVLNHLGTTKASITSRVYARHEYGKEKADAIRILAGRVQTITSGKSGNVLPFRVV